MFRPPPAAARPFAARAASWLVALALLLRLLLPALHHHHAGHGHGRAHDAAVVAPCSCGQVHERAPAPARGDGQHHQALVAAPHFCLACEVELGTPGACAELPPPLPAPQVADGSRSPDAGRLAAVATDRRPPTRAPPARSC